MSKIRMMLHAFLLAPAVACHHPDPVGPNPPPPPPPPPPADVQPPTASITSPNGGAILTGMVSIAVSAQDNLGVTAVELLIDGVVVGTDNAAPWGFNWDTDLLGDGSRNLVARAYDQAGNIGSSSAVTVTVRHPFALSFRNSTYTDITLNAANQGTVSVPVGSVFTYTYPSKPSSVGFSAMTSGRTIEGLLVGLPMLWNDTYLSGSARADTVDLIVTGTYFFVMVKNCGSTINGFYVNYGLVSQTFDNISIPGDCVIRSIGYYRAFANTEVRGYRGAAYSYWDQGVHFVLPWTNNQSATLLNIYSSPAIASGVDARVAEPSRETLPQAVDLHAWLSAKTPAAKQFAARVMEN